jgi:hypothetical protein
LRDVVINVCKIPGIIMAKDKKEKHKKDKDKKRKRDDDDDERAREKAKKLVDDVHSRFVSRCLAWHRQS